MDSLFNDEVIIRSKQRFRNDYHRVYTEEVNKIALSTNDDKRIHIFDKVTTFPYGTNIFKGCDSEMLSKKKLSEPDEDKDKTTPKAKTKAEDKDKTTPKTMTRTEDNNEDIDRGRDMLI